MGGGSWSATTYTSTASTRAASGTPTFAYDAHVKSTGVFKPHETLDAKKPAGPASPVAGQNIRESRDSDEHPMSVPIRIVLDVTASNDLPARVIHAELPKLFALLLRKGYVEDPQISMCAVTDAIANRIVLQVGEFESDNRIDDTLTNIVLEGGGGNHESYELMAYVTARKTLTDAWEKRGKKGYLFFIGDERAYAKVRAEQVAKFVGDSLEEDIDTKAIFDELNEKWEVYFIFCNEGSYGNGEDVTPSSATDSTAYGWEDLVGQRVLMLPKSNAVCELIATEIGVNEGTIDLDEGLENLDSVGSGAHKDAISKALAPLHAGGGGAVAVADSSVDLDVADSGIERL